MKPILLAILFALVAQTSIAQQNQLEINEVYYKTSDFRFNAEWQYLSTDLYLMNMGTVNTLLTDLWGSERQWKKNVQSIFITAQLQGSVLDGLTYPLYNFVSEQNGGTMELMDSYDGIHIIDNMPLSDKDNLISSKISMEVVTKSKPSVVMDFVNRQMGLIAGFTSFPKAVQTLTGELAKLGANATKKYVFNSTIQIYKDFNPDRKIHSIGVYFFHPNGLHWNLDHNDSIAFNHFVKTADSHTNKHQLFELMKWKKYPYLIVVNYKSKYASNLDTKTEITERGIISREDEINRKYNNHEIFPEIYEQETQLNEFLRAYVDLHNTDVKYSYNNSPAILLDVARKYQALLNLKDVKFSKLASNDVFNGSFKKFYNEIVDKSTSELSRTQQLAKAIELVKIIKEYKTFSDYESNEQTLAKLNYFDLDSDDFSMQISQLKSRIEESIYQNIFVPLIDDIDKDFLGISMFDFLQQKAESTHCQTCKSKAEIAISNYKAKLDEKRNEEANNQLSEAKDTAHLAIRNAKNCIYNVQNCGFEIADDYFKSNLSKLENKKNELETLLDSTPNEDKQQFAATIKSLTAELNRLVSNLERDLEMLKKQNQKYTNSAVSKFNESVALWQSRAQQLKQTINKILNMVDNDEVHFTLEQERAFKNIAQEFNRLNAISKESPTLLTATELDKKADDLKNSSAKLIEITNKFFNNLF